MDYKQKITAGQEKAGERGNRDNVYETDFRFFILQELHAFHMLISWENRPFSVDTPEKRCYTIPEYDTVLCFSISCFATG